MDENNNNNNDYEIVREVTDEIKPLGFGERIINIFLSPSKVMKNIKVYPKAFAPLPVFVLVFLIMAVLYPRISQVTLEAQSFALIERYGIDFMNMDGLDISGFNAIAMVSTFISGILGMYIGALFGSILMIILAKIMRCKGKFATFYSMYLHIYIVTSILSIITSVFYIITKSTMDVLSLGILMPNGNLFDISFMLLNSISVANIWSTILIFIGFKTINETTNAKAGVAAAISLAISLVLAAGTAVVMGTYYDFFYNLF